MAEQRAAHKYLQLYTERFPGMKDLITSSAPGPMGPGKTGYASGKAGPLFTPDPDAIPEAVSNAFDAAASVGLDRQDFARLALLCLSEAASAFGPQAKAVDAIRQLMLDSGMYAPEPAEK